jgi:hypothetical protein
MSAVLKSGQLGYSDTFTLSEKAYDSWSKSGLLEGLCEDNARALALKLENLAIILLNTTIITLEQSEKDEKLSVFSFPILRRIFNKNKQIDEKDVYKELSLFYDKNWDNYKELNGPPGFDNEGEFCHDFSEKYVCWYKQRLILKRYIGGKK